MITINTVSDSFFTLDGIQYGRIYQPLVQGVESISIVNIFDTRDKLLNSTRFDEFTVDGAIFTSQADLIVALLGVVFSKNSITGVESYATLADLPTVGELNVSYKVTNDTTASNNGYYHWDGAAYVKDADLNAELTAQDEAEAVAIVGIFNSDLTFIGFADTGTSTPSSFVEGSAWIATEDGLIFGILVSKGSIIRDTGAAYVGEYPSDYYTKATTTVSIATPTPIGQAKENEYIITALAADAVFAAPSGTAKDRNTLTLVIDDDGTARALSFNTIYEGALIPSTTVVGETLVIGFRYNENKTKWQCIGTQSV